MTVQRYILAATLLFCPVSAVLAASPASENSLDGEWRAELKNGKIGEFVFKFDCQDGKLTGELVRGSEGSEPISQGTCSGEEFEFQVSAGDDVWLWSGSIIADGKMRCHRQKQGRNMRQTVMAVR